jgi:hypothetical protein
MSLSLTKAASLALGIPAHGCSDAHVWYDAWSTYYYTLRLSEKKIPHSAGALTHTNDPELEPTTLRSHESWVDEPHEIASHEDPYVHQGMRSYEVEGVFILVADAEHYAYRGPTLRLMNSLEYELSIKIMRAPKPKKAGADSKEHPGAGRPHCRIFHFASGHPLQGHYAQQERAKLMSPKRAGNPAPKFPHKVPPNTIPSAAWVRQHETACAFYEANFIPWDHAHPPQLTIESFERYTKMLECDAARNIMAVESNSNDLGLAAFLREGPKRVHATCEDRTTFERRLCAYGVLTSIDNFANGIEVTKSILEANKHLRFRNRHHWNEKEAADYALHRDKPQEPSSIEKEMDAIRSRQEARRRSEKRVQQASDNEIWTSALLSNLNDATGWHRDTAHHEPMSAPPEDHMDQENADRVIHALEQEKLEIFDVDENRADPSASPLNNAAKDDDVLSDPLKRISSITQEAYLAEAGTWVQHGRKGYPPLNLDQRAILRTLVPTLEERAMLRST